MMDDVITVSPQRIPYSVPDPRVQIGSTTLTATVSDDPLYRTVLLPRFHPTRQYSATRTLSVTKLERVAALIDGYSPVYATGEFISAASQMDRLSDGLFGMVWTYGLSRQFNHSLPDVYSSVYEFMIVLTQLVFWNLNGRMAKARSVDQIARDRLPETVIHFGHTLEEVWNSGVEKEVPDIVTTLSSIYQNEEHVSNDALRSRIQDVLTTTARKWIATITIQEIDDPKATKLVPMGAFFRFYLYALSVSLYLKCPELYSLDTSGGLNAMTALYAKVRSVCDRQHKNPFGRLMSRLFTFHEWSADTRAAARAKVRSSFDAWSRKDSKWPSLPGVMGISRDTGDDKRVFPSLISHVCLPRLLQFVTRPHTLASLRSDVLSFAVSSPLSFHAYEFPFVECFKPKKALGASDYKLNTQLATEKANTTKGEWTIADYQAAWSVWAHVVTHSSTSSVVLDADDEKTKTKRRKVDVESPDQYPFVYVPQSASRLVRRRMQVFYEFVQTSRPVIPIAIRRLCEWMILCKSSLASDVTTSRRRAFTSLFMPYVVTWLCCSSPYRGDRVHRQLWPTASAAASTGHSGKRGREYEEIEDADSVISSSQFSLDSEHSVSAAAAAGSSIKVTPVRRGRKWLANRERCFISDWLTCIQYTTHPILYEPYMESPSAAHSPSVSTDTLKSQEANAVFSSGVLNSDSRWTTEYHCFPAAASVEERIIRTSSGTLDEERLIALARVYPSRVRCIPLVYTDPTAVGITGFECWAAWKGPLSKCVLLIPSSDKDTFGLSDWEKLLLDRQCADGWLGASNYFMSAVVLGLMLTRLDDIHSQLRPAKTSVHVYTRLMERSLERVRVRARDALRKFKWYDELIVSSLTREPLRSFDTIERACALDEPMDYHEPYSESEIAASDGELRLADRKETEWSNYCYHIGLSRLVLYQSEPLLPFDAKWKETAAHVQFKLAAEKVRDSLVQHLAAFPQLSTMETAKGSTPELQAGLHMLTPFLSTICAVPDLRRLRVAYIRCRRLTSGEFPASFFAIPYADLLCKLADFLHSESGDELVVHSQRVTGLCLQSYSISQRDAIRCAALLSPSILMDVLELGETGTNEHATALYQLFPSRRRELSLRALVEPGYAFCS